MDARRRFEAAVRDVRALPSAPGTAALLELHALYKQATVGDVNGPRPGVLDVRARAKHDAWARAKGLSTDEAMARYVPRVARLSSG